jgi:hypothetical protein
MERQDAVETALTCQMSNGATFHTLLLTGHPHQVQDLENGAATLKVLASKQTMDHSIAKTLVNHNVPLLHPGSTESHALPFMTVFAETAAPQSAIGLGHLDQIGPIKTLIADANLQLLNLFSSNESKSNLKIS